MVKAYIPIDKRQGKASIRGLWKGSQGVCYDYLKRISLEPCQLVYVKKHYRQEAIFYREKDKAFVWYNTKKIETLNRQTYFGYDKQTRGLKAFIKDLLKTYGGLTVYVREADYLFEVWHSQKGF